MGIVVTRESPASLAGYARISIAFEVQRVLDVASLDLPGHFHATERDVEPYVKDYDAVDGGPLAWP